MRFTLTRDTASCTERPLYVMVVLAHATGLRQSVLLGVRWTDLELDTGILPFDPVRPRRHPARTQDGRRAPCTVTPQPAIEVLHAYRDQQDRERATAAHLAEVEVDFSRSVPAWT